MEDVAVEGKTRVLAPANENPWYVLMTLHGEQTGEGVDYHLHDNNLAAWNSWACQRMSAEQRAKASEGKTSAISAWPQVSRGVERRHKEEMAQRNGAGFAYPGLPDVEQGVYLIGIESTHHVIMSGMVFSGHTRFGYSTLRRSVFGAATFGGVANFNNVMFGGSAYFSSTFTGDASFDSSKFSLDAHFLDATFGGDARFCDLTFGAYAGFRSVVFNKDVVFGFTNFCGHADFDSVEFGGSADFTSSTFSDFAHFCEAKFGGSQEDDMVRFTDCQFRKPGNPPPKVRGWMGRIFSARCMRRFRMKTSGYTEAQIIRCPADDCNAIGRKGRSCVKLKAACRWPSFAASMA
jgi:hypothetical protein